jgi:site-specific DNA-methyltransferase (adenine-specific)
VLYSPMWKVLIGDCHNTLATLPAGSVHTCVTSPPYYGMRDYGVSGQLGHEARMDCLAWAGACTACGDCYVCALVDRMRGVRRVLRDDGTLWINLGDSYRVGDTGVRAKNLVGMPWHVALALQADGWNLRQDIIWHKPNPLPESVRDRCTKAHEHIFLLSKSKAYYFDADAIAEPATGRVCGNKRHKQAQQAATAVAHGDHTTRTKLGLSAIPARTVRNRRDVWTQSLVGFGGGHFAVFPPGLIEPCILAGCPSRCCSRCGSPLRSPSCTCNAEPCPGVVLDPFAGSGTTAGVAVQHGRSAILVELNPDYARMIPDRVLSILRRA